MNEIEASLLLPLIGNCREMLEILKSSTFLIRPIGIADGDFCYATERFASHAGRELQ